MQPSSRSSLIKRIVRYSTLVGRVFVASAALAIALYYGLQQLLQRTPIVVAIAKFLFASVGFFEFAHIQFIHTKHSSANPISFSSVWITHHDV